MHKRLAGIESAASFDKLVASDGRDRMPVNELRVWKVQEDHKGFVIQQGNL